MKFALIASDSMLVSSLAYDLTCSQVTYRVTYDVTNHAMSVGFVCCLQGAC